MAMELTNRALATLTIAQWNVPADIGVGLLAGASVPGALTSAAIEDVNFISELLALTGVDEPTDGSYARVNPVTMGTAAEDDTNNRVNFPVGAAYTVDFGALDNEQIYAAFWYIDGGSDAARVVLGVDIFSGVETANGAGFVYNPGGAATDDVFRFQHG